MKKRSPVRLFALVFCVLIVWTLITNMVGSKVILLTVKDNAGVSLLESVDNTLVCVFQDGRLCTWDWSELSEPEQEIRLNTDRVAILDNSLLAAVDSEGDKILSVINWKSEEKQFELKVGYEDQDVWPRAAQDKSTLAIIRKNTYEPSEDVLYEFMIVNIDEQRTELPVTMMISSGEQLEDFVLDSQMVVYAVGNRSGQGRMIALNLESGDILWDSMYEGADEFCSVIVSNDNQYILAGSRDGILYKLDAQSGDIIKKIQLLKEGETRAITNDYSVLNLAFSPDGQYYVATINPPAYILEAVSDSVIHKFSPANRLVSKIAFSPDNTFVATSDIRAGWPIKIWPIPDNK